MIDLEFCFNVLSGEVDFFVEMEFFYLVGMSVDDNLVVDLLLI